MFLLYGIQFYVLYAFYSCFSYCFVSITYILRTLIFFLPNYWDVFIRQIYKGSIDFSITFIGIKLIASCLGFVKDFSILHCLNIKIFHLKNVKNRMCLSLTCMCIYLKDLSKGCKNGGPLIPGIFFFWFGLKGILKYF